MESSRIVSIVLNYKNFLENEGLTPKRLDIAVRWNQVSQEALKCHVLYLIGVVISLSVNPSEVQTINRLLGCIQGMLGMLGMFTTEDLMNHNKKPEDLFVTDPHAT